MFARYFGIDVHKDFAVIVAVNDQQETVFKPVKVPMSQLKSWAAKHLSQDDEVVFEVTTNAWTVYDMLVPYAGRVFIANPAKTRLIAQARIKSDVLDALVLAQLLASRFICDVWVPSSSVREQRALAAHRATLRRQTTQVKNRLHALLHRYNLRCPVKSLFSTEGRAWLSTVALPDLVTLQRDHLLAQLQLLEQQLSEADQRIAALAQHDPRVVRLMQITGIGVFTAFTVLAAIGDVRRFSSPKKLVAYAGLAPSLHQSGQRSFTGRITKAGQSNLRWLMVEAARAAARYDPHWQRVFERISHRRGTNIAAVAVARKLLVVVWHLLYHDADYYHLRPQAYVQKLQNWAYQIGRDQRLGTTTASFVGHQLDRIGLHDLAASLGPNAKGALIVSSA